jgi:hypothetical protein
MIHFQNNIKKSFVGRLEKGTNFTLFNKMTVHLFRSLKNQLKVALRKSGPL